MKVLQLLFADVDYSFVKSFDTSSKGMIFLVFIICKEEAAGGNLFLTCCAAGQRQNKKVDRVTPKKPSIHNQAVQENFAIFQVKKGTIRPLCSNQNV